MILPNPAGFCGSVTQEVVSRLGFSAAMKLISTLYAQSPTAATTTVGVAAGVADWMKTHPEAVADLRTRLSAVMVLPAESSDMGALFSNGLASAGIFTQVIDEWAVQNAETAAGLRRAILASLGG